MNSNGPIVDTFPSFLAAAETDMPDSIEAWLSLWTEKYMVNWPELFDMQVADYRQEGEDWQQVAREMVFPGMHTKLLAMQKAHQDLRNIIGPVEARARHELAFRGRVTYVIYVGLGNGAGWVTTYDGQPAVLFGLEGIVDSGFDSPTILEGLVAHELGHVVHFSWREQGGLRIGSGPYWQLYEEGFAQRCESEILGRDNWHMRTFRQGDDWLAWCHEHRDWLAAEFLKAADRGDSVRPFFGSWYEVRGRKQTGYYLGEQVIRHLTDTMSLGEIALLEAGDRLDETIRRVLSAWVTS